MKILIPSYKRCGSVSTLDFLHGEIFTANDIIISTQTESDFNAYRKAYKGKATIIYREGNCVGDNRNTLLQYCQKHGINKAMMLDDDISSIRFINGGRATTPEQVYSLFSSCFAVAEKADAPLWGCYWVANNLFMKKSVTISLLVGTCLGFLDTSVQFNPKYRIKEDAELCLRWLRQGRKVLRFNSFAMVARFRAKGGCFDDWQNYPDGEIYADMLLQEYPDLLEIDKRAKFKEVKLKKL